MLARLVAVLVALSAMVIVWHPARVAVQALLLLPALFPSAPFEPLNLVTAAPSRAEHRASYAGGTLEAHLFRPAGGGQHGAIMLFLGAGDLPRSDLAVRFADALARLGVVALLPGSSGMLAERLTFDEVDAVRVSVDLLAAEPSVDRSRVGLVGLSASGGLGIVAAGQPDLRDRISFVNSFGSYADAKTFLVDVASRSMAVSGEVKPWRPEQRTVDVVVKSLGDALPQEALREVQAGTTRDRAERFIAALSPAARERLDRVSPSAYLAGMRARLYLMHDVDDSFIPFTQSRALVASAPPGVVQRYTEFAIFAHVIPDRPVPWQTFLPDLWRLFWHVHAVLLEVL